MSNILIVEGINKVGKSSIIKYLEEVHGYHVINDDMNFDYVSDRYAWQIHSKGQAYAYLEMMKHLDDNQRIVFDRFHFSEFVYGLVDREYYSDWVRDVDEKLALIGVKVLFMDDDVEEASKRAEVDLTMYDNLYKVCYDFCICDKKMHNMNAPITELLQWLGLREEEDDNNEAKQAV